MIDQHKDIIRHFLKSPLMYVTNTDQGQVTAFVHGFEIGTGNICDLSNKISKVLEEKYKLKKIAVGWPYQIQQFADKNSITWFDAFVVITNEVLRDF